MNGLAGPTLTGPRLDLGNWRGHVVVVNVWASWCKQCRAESPSLAALAARLRPKGVRFVGIDEQEIARQGRAYVARSGTDYPNLIDAYGDLLRKLPMLPPDAMPSTLVIDPQGRAAARVVGVINPRRLARVIPRVARS